jgi:hypothetical protein
MRGESARLTHASGRGRSTTSRWRSTLTSLIERVKPNVRAAPRRKFADFCGCAYPIVFP